MMKLRNRTNGKDISNEDVQSLPMDVQELIQAFDLSKTKLRLADIPVAETEIEIGHPICSIISEQL